ncbi:transcriptional regulator, IclR family [Cognatiyoonia koreensis]|uniref:Transcriptional regulator, IclR family n=1 Tax=Cognatiyoonia koreensis TaxID=364200 RepID=A0A1I0RAR8_9RHOB|nr:IclR family transcriptional regulator [Cognatiyoonia koreensis]SEW37881.1 transcriptional regulator, IclR family [Cognatiyoonia koreensis]
MARGAGDGTVGKALEVLDQVAEFGRPVRFAELLADSNFPKPTLYRLLQTLTSQGMLAFDPDRNTYSPGARLMKFAHAAWSQSTLAQVASPHVQLLSEATGETVHLAQLDSAQVLYLDKRNARQPVEMYSQAGKIGPAYCTGVGKAMIAFLPEDEAADVIGQQSFHVFTPTTLATADALQEELVDIRANGYGFDREEHEPGIICVAMPILSESGRVLGALSVTSTTQHTNLAGLEQQVPHLRKATNAIAQAAKRWSFPDHHSQKTTTGI